MKNAWNMVGMAAMLLVVGFGLFFLGYPEMAMLAALIAIALIFLSVVVAFR